MGKITGRYHKNPLKTARGVAETRLTIEKLPKGHNSSKNQLSMTSVKYDQVIKISFIKIPLKMWEELRRQELMLIKWLKLIKGHNSGKKQSSVTSV